MNNASIKHLLGLAHAPIKKPSLRTIQRTTKSRKHPLPLVLLILIVLMAGMIFSLALAPYHLWLMAILSPMVLYALLVSTDSPMRAFWLGEAYGFGVWVVGAFWLYTSIHEYGSVPAVLAFIMIVLMALVMGLFHAIMAWAFVFFMGRQPMAFAGLWVVQEWCKTWVLTGFPWLFVGYAFTEVQWIASLAPVIGVFGLSFVAVLIAAAIVEVFRAKISFLIIACIPMVCGAVLYYVNPSWTSPTGDKLSVSLVQGNIPQDLKWLTEYRFETLQIYAQLSTSEWGQDVVVWPEASIPMFQDEAAEFIWLVAEQARRSGSTWVTGIPYRDHASFNPAIHEYEPMYNSVLALGDDSGGLYKKQRLVPFGEYVPMSGLFNILPNLANMQDVMSFSRGEVGQDPLKIKGKSMGAAICYEVAYPNTTRLNAINTDFLLTISNDAWFGTSAGPRQHLQMVQMRSLETGRWFIRATNTGVTAFIDNKGHIVAQAPSFTKTVLRHEVPSYTGRTPYMIMGNVPILLLSILLLLLSYIAKRLTNRRKRTQTGQGVLD